MLIAEKLNKLIQQNQLSTNELAQQLVRGGFNKTKAARAVKSWRKGLHKPAPEREDIRRLAAALSADISDIIAWQSSHRYAPMSPSKVRLVARLIVGRSVQDAMDVLKFSHNRAGYIDRKSVV